ncbi:isopropylmalate isomerase small subunit [Lentisphaera araneosa HTCC2155]|jgi:3-isopropylmalate/(R)-2-methylmalate dehydratase small subunit|uniref:3-isopropylmalate dehydratase n=1 Tax=Lentisphaera araneosa HTCC2155 TaxID=313628 RepID=A6DJB2_9BACT|nr:3-isopropylmalate dehydratase small subunit [Lentisphaera araneosa]EDM28548.1 isopropylmalate isomerase small subunit [Lentisphaera araneosa HTCC2155]
MNSSSIIKITGTGVAVRGNDIDTDRIIPARFLTKITFEGLGAEVFTDDRKQLADKGEVHPFDQEAHAKSNILLVNKNFGCGSSREHAPQAIKRHGIDCIIGESYSEIFFGNNIAIGVPCLKVSEADIALLQDKCEQEPECSFSVDLESLEIKAGDLSVKAEFPEGARQQFIGGTWDVTAELLQNDADITETAANLPYFNHWK